MAKYYMVQMPDLQGTGERRLYPKVVHVGQATLDEVAESVTERASFSPGDVKGLVATLSDVIASKLALGQSVKIDGIGTFSLGLGFREEVEREEVAGTSKRNARSIEVQKVYLRVDSALLQEVNDRIVLERTEGNKISSPKSSKEERLEKLLEYLERREEIRVKDYILLTHLTRSRASRELREFAEAGHIRRKGAGAHSYYTK